MAFRDDHEALLLRAETLEQDLHVAQQELESARDARAYLQRQLEEERARSETLERKNRLLEKKVGGGGGAVPWILIAGFVLTAVVAFGVMTSRSSSVMTSRSSSTDSLRAPVDEAKPKPVPSRVVVDPEILLGSVSVTMARPKPASPQDLDAPVDPAVGPDAGAAERPAQRAGAADAGDDLRDEAAASEAPLAPRPRLLIRCPADGVPPVPPAFKDQYGCMDATRVRQGLLKVKGRISACYAEHKVEGKVHVKLTINGAGLPPKVSIQGRFHGTNTGDCMIQAFRAARFPHFSGGPIRVALPLVLK